MADSYFCGLRGTGDVVTNEDPGAWRKGILRLFPNGDTQLTGLTSMMKSEKVDGPHFHWWTKTLTTQRGAVALYTDAGLHTLYASAGVAGDVLYGKVTAAVASMFRTGQQVLLRDASDLNVDVTARVTNVIVNGASSIVAVMLLEADDNATATSHDLSDADTILCIGNMNPQGGTRPEAITQSPTEFENYTQIWRDSLDLARTLLKTKLRTEDAYTEAKRDCLELHGLAIEKGLLFSTLYTGTGSNGKPLYATRGLMSWVKEYGTVQDYALDTGADYVGKTWLQGGEQWLDEHFEEIFRYGSQERLAYCGSGALLGIQRLAKESGWTNITPKTTQWGSNVREWVTPQGVITLKTHPLFSQETTLRNAMLIFEPANLVWKYIDDTFFTPDELYGKGGGTGYDGKQEEYITEAGIEVHFPETGGLLSGVGSNNG